MILGPHSASRYHWENIQKVFYLLQLLEFQLHLKKNYQKNVKIYL